MQTTFLFRCREMRHQDQGRPALDAIREKLSAVGKVERPPPMDGGKMTALPMPAKPAPPDFMLIGRVTLRR